MDVADEAVALVERWLRRAASAASGPELRTAQRLQRLIDEPGGLRFAMGFADRVVRAEDRAVAAHQLRSLVDAGPVPRFLSPVDRMLLRAGAVLGPALPDVVVPLARRRLRALVGHLVADARPGPLAEHLSARRRAGFDVNVNLLGEAVLGEGEARRRRDDTIAMLQRPDVEYASVKVSAVASQLNLWADDETRARVVDRLHPVFAAAARSRPAKFVNLDMEEYRDLHLTVDVFRTLLDEPAFETLEAGIALQAYLPDSFDVLRELVTWAEARHARTGGQIKVRLVKGANLAMEKVDAAIHGWPQAPYATKVEVDANYKRLIDWSTGSGRSGAVRVGIASHNLFDVAWAHLLSQQRGVAGRVEFEMLQGMAPAQARLVRDVTGGVRLYTPVVAPAQFDVAISYLFRRLEEGAAPENFLRQLSALAPGSLAFEDEAARFRASVATRWSVPAAPRRQQDRAVGAVGWSSDAAPLGGVVAGAAERFANEPDTDPSLAANRWWARTLVAEPFAGPSAPLVTDTAVVDDVVARAVAAQRAWARTSAAERRRVLHAVAGELAARRGRLVHAMVHEGGKTVAEADPEVSEAIDFARWYGDRALELDSVDGASFEPFGVVVVAPPWNFPVAIPAGGVLASLAAGNAVVCKPAPETPACAEAVVEAAWAAGVPRDLLALLRVPDDEVGRHLVTHPEVAAVVLSGSWETAQLFRRWRPELALFAETSGKNSMIITPSADLDLAVADVVRSAFGHAGQKCSAVSLAICVGSVAASRRFRRQLIDATGSVVVGPSTSLPTVMGPLIGPPGGKLRRGLTELEPGQRWLVEPRQLDDDGRLWSPGVRDGVVPGSEFHRTEYFGPVLGLMAARDLDEAIAVANAQPYGLTGGIHSLERAEVERWLERIEVGNAYVNRHTTGAIVRRQPFGGWKRSTVGSGAKAGGPNYVSQLGRWTPAPLGAGRSDARAEGGGVAGGGGGGGGGAARTVVEGQLSGEVASLLARVAPLFDDADIVWLRAAAGDDERWWRREYGVEHDPSGLYCEANVFRYRPRPPMLVRAGEGSATRALARVLLAAARCGVPVSVSVPVGVGTLAVDFAAEVGAAVEWDEAFAASLAVRGGTRVRHLGPAPSVVRAAAAEAGVDVVDAAVTASGRIELLWFLREQAISRTLHRYGNVAGQGR